jgi:cellulose synthase (UDP-forming)
MLKNSFMSKGLSWYQKLSYFSATFFWFFAISRVVFYLAPLMYMFFGLKIYSANDMEMIAYVVPHILMAVMMSYFLYAKVRNPFFSEIYETVLSFFTLPAIFQTLWNPRNPTFEVTPKDVDITETYVSEFAIPFVIMLTLVGFGFVAAAIRLILYPDEASIILMTSFWNFLNFLLLITAIAVTSEKGDVRRYIRIPLNRGCNIIADGHQYHGKITDISEGGASIEPVHKEGKEDVLTESKNIEIELLDINGKEFKVPATFLRSYKWGSTLIFVFKDLEENISVRQKLIQIIYGNTTAWEEFESKNRIMNPIESFAYIMKQSFKNAMVREAYALTFKYVKNLIPKGKEK